MGRSVEFIRLHARRGFYQNHMYDAISGQRFNYPLFIPCYKSWVSYVLSLAKVLLFALRNACEASGYLEEEVGDDAV